LPARAEAADFLNQFIAESISSGFVAGLIEKHGVVGKLSVAPLING